MKVKHKRIQPVVRGASCLFAVAALGAVVLWILPALLTRQPSLGVSAAERLTAVNDVRTPIVTFLVAIGAAGTLWFTGRSFILSREGHVTDRYTKAIGQRGDKSSPVRVGGVYALERIGHDSVKDRTTIIYVLGAFIRERSKATGDREDDPPEDVKAGIRVVGRLLPLSEVTLDLRDADLRNTDLSGLSDDQVLREGANLEGAKLPRGAHPADP